MIHGRGENAFPSKEVVWMQLLHCSVRFCQQGDQRDSWNEEVWLYRIQNPPASNCAIQKRLAVALILLLFIHRQDERKQNICAPGNMRTICMKAVVQRERERDLQKPNLLHRSNNTAVACCWFNSSHLISLQQCGWNRMMPLATVGMYLTPS